MAVKIWANISEVLKNVATNGSLHGFVYLFTNRPHRVKQLWMATIALIFTICIYQLTLTAYEHLVERPTVTTKSYNYRSSALFPNVFVCPNQGSHSAFVDQIVRQNYPRVDYEMIGYMTTHPMFSDVRKHLSEDVASLFLKYPRLEVVHNRLQRQYEKRTGVSSGPLSYFVGFFSAIY